MEPNDETMVAQVLAGDTESFSYLVRKYQGAVFALTLSMTRNTEEARDLTQETFIKAYLNLLTLRNPVKFASWLKRIAWTTCSQWGRDTANRHFLLSQISEESQKTPEDLILDKERKEMVAAALNTLSEKLVQATLLRYVDELSYREIASFQGVPLSTVRSRLYESHKRLRAVLSKEGLSVMRHILKHQAPEENLPDDVMEILDRIPIIHSVKLIMESGDDEGRFLMTVEYERPDKLRIESETDLRIYNGNEVWHYIPMDHLATRSSDADLTRKYPKDCMPIWFALLSSDWPRTGYHTRLEQAQTLRNRETQFLGITPKAETNRIVYCTPIAYSSDAPEGVLLVNNGVMTYAVRSVSREEGITLGIDAEHSIPMFMQGQFCEDGSGNLVVLPINAMVTRFGFFGEHIPFPVEIEIQDMYGRRRCVRFSQIDLNSGILPERFRLVPPETAIVVDNDIFSHVDDAIDAYERKVGANPEDTDSHVALAMLYSKRRGRGSPKLIEHLEEAHKRRPDIDGITYWLADTYRWVGQDAKALALAKGLSHSRSYQPREALDLGPILEHSGQEAEAIQHYRQCLTSDAINDIYKMPLAGCLVRLCLKNSTLPELIAETKRSGDGNHDGTELWRHFLLGYAYLESGMRLEAAEVLRKMLEAHHATVPWSTLREETDRIVRRAGLEVELKAFYETQLRSLAGTSVQESLQKRLMSLYLRLGDVQGLETCYRELRKRGDLWREAPGIGVRGVLGGLGKAEVQELANVIESAANTPTLFLLLGDIWLDYLGDTDHAMRMYRRASELAPDDPDVYVALGMAQLRQQDYAGALASYHLASELAPARMYYRCWQAYAYNSLREHEQAIGIGQRIVEDNPDDPDAHIILGTICFNAAQYEHAMSAFVRGRELSRKTPGSHRRDEFLDKLTDLTQDRLT